MAQDATILHVDDEPSFTDLTKAFLEREDDGFHVQTVTGAEEGLDALGDRPPDCIVSDYNMPGMDGLEFLETVREKHPDLPFILFTGKGSEEVASDAISAGVTDYLQKGTGTEQYELLANRVRNAVQARREAQRADRQEQLMRLTEFAGDTGGFELDTETGEVLMTDGTRRILHLPEAANPNFEENLQHYHPDDRGEIQQTIQRALRTGERTQGTWRYQHPDGDEQLLDVSYTPATDSGDAVTVRGAIHDITEHRERQQELRQARDLMSKVEVLADVGAWEYDPGTETLMLTDGARRLYGLEPGADITLEEAFEQFHPDDRDTLVDRFDTCLETGAAYEVDLRLTTPGDGHRWVTAHGERVKKGSGEVVRGYIRSTIPEEHSNDG
ncbi:MAG: DNA-binding response OmpR family regulator [Natronomonas sp.]|jgi:DNA-binding response OmpR family regulator